MKPPKVLLVDDDIEFVKALAARCVGLGMEVQKAHNTLTALTILGLGTPDIICLDVEMPTGNGLGVREFLMSDPTVAEVPVVILTGHRNEGTIKRCAELRARYVHKSPDYWPRLRKAFGEIRPELADAPN
jgi:CheY-like chemotaxis protein